MLESAFCLLLSLTGQRGRTTSSVMARGVDCACALHPAYFVSVLAWQLSKSHEYKHLEQKFSKATPTQGCSALLKRTCCSRKIQEEVCEFQGLVIPLLLKETVQQFGLPATLPQLSFLPQRPALASHCICLNSNA